MTIIDTMGLLLPRLVTGTAPFYEVSTQKTVMHRQIRLQPCSSRVLTPGAIIVADLRCSYTFALRCGEIGQDQDRSVPEAIWLKAAVLGDSIL